MKIKIEFEASLEPKGPFSAVELIQMWLYDQCDTTLEIPDPNTGDVVGEMLIPYDEPKDIKVEVSE